MEKVDAMTIGEKLLVTKGAHGDIHLQDIPMVAKTLIIDGKNRTEETVESSAVEQNNKAQVEDVWHHHDDDSSTDCGDFKPEPEEKPKRKPKKAKSGKRIVFEENLDDEELAVEFSQAQTFNAFVDDSDDDDA